MIPVQNVLFKAATWTLVPWQPLQTGFTASTMYVPLPLADELSKLLAGRHACSHVLHEHLEPTVSLTLQTTGERGRGDGEAKRKFD